MRVPQRLDYALRALVLLAEQPSDDVVVAGDLADRLGLPRRFVEQQVSAMARAGIVTCRRGAAGGCSLARPAEEITIALVVEAVQGDVLDIPKTTGSASSEMWAGAQRALAEYFLEVTLADLAKRQLELDASRTPMYYI
jgi:Rrf2 family protein